MLRAFHPATLGTYVIGQIMVKANNGVKCGFGQGGLGPSPPTSPPTPAFSFLVLPGLGLLQDKLPAHSSGTLTALSWDIGSRAPRPATAASWETGERATLQRPQCAPGIREPASPQVLGGFKLLCAKAK